MKTIEKGFSGICIILEMNFDSEEGKKTKVLMDSTMHSVSMSLRDRKAPVLVYPAVKLLKDEYGRREWRAFVV